MEKEGELIEYKKSLAELDSAIIDICAMLNKHNKAHVIFGVKDDLKPSNVKFGKDTLRKIENKIFTSIEPRVYPTINFEKIDNCDVVSVTVLGNNKIYSANKIFYTRIGECSRSMNIEQIYKMFATKKVAFWEMMESESTINDIDLESLHDFFDAAISNCRIQPQKFDPIKLLTSLGLIHEDGKHLNKAGELLFSNKNPISLQLGTYASKEKIKHIDLSLAKGNIFKLINISMNYITSRINWSYHVEGLKRVETPEIPLDALREIIVNSFAHALYIDLSSSHRIAISPIDIEIYNPGSFPEGLTPIDYVNSILKSQIRNHLIANTLYLCKYIEQWGSGFKKTYNLCKKNNINVSFRRDYDGFWFTFNRPNILVQQAKMQAKLTENEMKILSLIMNKSDISYSELVKKSNISLSSVTRAIVSLKQKGFVRHTGSKRSGKWELLDNISE